MISLTILSTAFTGAITGLLASTIFIWAVIIVSVVLMAILLEYEREGWATTVFSLAIALVLWNFKADIWAYISAKPYSIVGFCLSYIVIGITWSFLKWRSYVKSIFDKFKKLRLEYSATNGNITDNNRGGFNILIEDAGFKDAYGRSITRIDQKASFEQIALKITPLASLKKSVISAWIAYWPVSLAGTLLNNPFKQFFDWIYSFLSGYYDIITNKHKKDAFGF